ncbi:MAG: alpha/beta fold hydrolase [Thermoanaerobaculales bacterium]|nr:alpha/beta fold hydrolase [Thermoanaerobaculales bacterium]
MSASEPITFSSTGGLRLAGILHSPTGEPSGLGVVVAHGMLSSKASDKHRAFCEAAARLGASAIRFDFRGRGESGGDPHDLTVSNEVEDTAAAIALLRDHGADRIALVGSSLGGTVAVLAAAADREIAGLVTIAAPSRLPDRPREAWGGNGLADDDGLVEVAPGERIHRRFFTDAGQHDPVAAAGTLHCPWLIIHGGLDATVFPSDARRFAEAAPAAVLELRPNANHRFDDPTERRWLVDRVADHIAELHC